MLTLGQAAKLTGTSKTTLTRAIRSGRLSAIRREDGGYEIDPAELSRVYALKVETPATGAATGGAAHQATPPRDLDAPPCDPEVTGRLAALDAEVRALRELLDEVRTNWDEVRVDRDQWRGKCERLLTDQRSLPWWKRLLIG